MEKKLKKACGIDDDDEPSGGGDATSEDPAAQQPAMVMGPYGPVPAPKQPTRKPLWDTKQLQKEVKGKLSSPFHRGPLAEWDVRKGGKASDDAPVAALSGFMSSVMYQQQMKEKGGPSLVHQMYGGVREERSVKNHWRNDS